MKRTFDLFQELRNGFKGQPGPQPHLPRPHDKLARGRFDGGALRECDCEKIFVINYMGGYPR